MSQVFVIMGVSGSGKTTVGLALARKLGVSFYDGDDFHPPENVAKMANGIPLTDEDRYPWLARLHDLIADFLARGNGRYRLFRPQEEIPRSAARRQRGRLHHLPERQPEPHLGTHGRAAGPFYETRHAAKSI